MEMNNKSVGIRIKSIRQSLGLSMTAFAQKIDSKSKSGAINNWETGNNLPNNEHLKRIAEIGNISVNELLYGKAGKLTTNNIAINRRGNKYTIVIKEGNQDRWLTLDKDSARELLSKLGSVLND